MGEAVPSLAPSTQLGGRFVPGARVVARRGDALVFLAPAEIWAFQAAGAASYVHCAAGRFDLQLALSQVEAQVEAQAEASFCRSFLRVHPDWLVDLSRVRAIERGAGPPALVVGDSLADGAGVRVPVARDRAQAVTETLRASATGLRGMALPRQVRGGIARRPAEEREDSAS